MLEELRVQLALWDRAGRAGIQSFCRRKVTQILIATQVLPVQEVEASRVWDRRP